ncbi:nicotinamide riboside transporter PnuC [Hufsiella ginkgonis]|uniref:Nicotinamide riboside transporter PnuC n=1 Tax=Hufsiella ginkgonis TaxID=2695274 RepID=A0A7K1XVW5_9SPHI|nr:nicotinamide riboside transporter PnuC [Hufsiella ginkgonis]MXV14967.1 nicotinamide riboside transporter PnuC [Hufsiella ginkgonis]
MDLQHWFGILTGQLKETTVLQWIAVSLGVTEVLLARINNVWLYPAGIAATAISMMLLTESGLYAETLLNGYYIVMSVYGWMHWITKKNEPPIKISYSTRQEWKITLAIVFIGWGVLYLALRYFTDSTVPVADSWISATAWAGMWLLARRKIENWILLNISNLFAIPLLFHKNLAMFGLLTAFLFVVAVFGYFDWKRKYRQQLSA